MFLCSLACRIKLSSLLEAGETFTCTRLYIIWYNNSITCSSQAFIRTYSKQKQFDGWHQWVCEALLWAMTKLKRAPFHLCLLKMSERGYIISTICLHWSHTRATHIWQSLFDFWNSTWILYILCMSVTVSAFMLVWVCVWELPLLPSGLTHLKSQLAAGNRKRKQSPQGSSGVISVWVWLFKFNLRYNGAWTPV